MRIAVVTGASRGIGKGVVKVLAAEGYRVHGCSANPDRVEAMVAEMAGEGLEVVGTPCDVSDRGAVFAFTQGALERARWLRVLLTNPASWKSTLLLPLSDAVWQPFFSA